MSFRVSDKSYLTSETDLPPSSRNIHPSGILHAFRTTNPPPLSSSSSSLSSKVAKTKSKEATKKANEEAEGGDPERKAKGDDADDDGDGGDSADKNTAKSKNDTTNNTSTHSKQKPHSFAWISNTLHIETLIQHYTSLGYDRTTELVFIPYSNRGNWTRRYPFAEVDLVCNESGRVDNLELLREEERALNNGDGGGHDHDECNEGGMGGEGNEVLHTANKPKGKKKRGRKRKNPKTTIKAKANIFRNDDYLADAERDELHVEIYNYLKWLHDKLVQLELEQQQGQQQLQEEGKEASAQVEEKKVEESTELEDTVTVPTLENDDGDASETMDEDKKNNEEGDNNNDGNANKNKKKAAPAKKRKKRPRRDNTGVDLAELKGVLERLEWTFAILPNMKLEQEKTLEEAKVTTKEEEELVKLNEQDGEQDGQKDNDDGKADEEGGQNQNKMKGTTDDDPGAKTNAASKQNDEGPPFLEQALSTALAKLVSARESSGKKRRSRQKRKRPRQTPTNDQNNDGQSTQQEGGPSQSQSGETQRPRKRKRQLRLSSSHGNAIAKRAPGPIGDFDDMFARLLKYKEEKGDCIVTRSYHDKKLGNWVNAMRNEKRLLAQRGLEHETPSTLEGKRILSKTITAERLERLNSIGFVWSVAGPKVSWEERFADCMNYYEMNGKWPSHSMGSLGEWVHKQRTLYAKQDEKYMMEKVPKLDEVGFEWTPRGNTRMNWDEGFELLMEYGMKNGHYEVPHPSSESGTVDRRSAEFRLYKWVESLHGMYRSYKLGRKSGSLTDERVVLLIKHGFTFRDK